MSRKKSSAKPTSDKPTISNERSGGADIDADRVDVGGDVVGRDKNVKITVFNDRINRAWLFALAGIVGVIIIVLGIIATRSPTAPIVTVNLPTNEPAATPLPNTPVPTATPIFVKNVPYRVAIAEFNQLADRKLAIEQRLEDDLDQQLEAAGLSNDVEVKVVSQPTIGSAQEAKQFAEATKSSVVIWGLYDDVGIRLRISLGAGASPSQTAPDVTRFGELSLASSGSETSTLSFYITSTLPANTSFLSFYVIGQLYYLSNQYAKGHAAFDTAMQQLPKTVAVENEALLHFFNARAIDSTNFDNAVTAICEYANAIAIDNQMFEAYNNLGTLVAEHQRTFSFGMLAEQDNQLQACTGKAGVKLNARELFSTALRIKPNLGIAQYNLGMLDWNTDANCAASPDCESTPSASQSMLQNREQAESTFAAALKSDPSIPGAHIGLGNMAMWRGDFVAATDQFSAALSLVPQSPEIAVNLGQALALASRETEAEAAYRQAIRNAPENSLASLEAHLALGNFYHRAGDLTHAYAEYERAQEVQTKDPNFNPGNNLFAYDPTRYYASQALNLALAQYEISAGEWVSASQRVGQLQQARKDYERGSMDSSNLQVTGLDVYLSWLVNTARGQTDTLQSQGTYTVTLDPTVPPFIGWSYGNVASMAWYDLVKLCKTTAVDDFRTWGSSANPCLPSDPKERLNAVFEIIQHRMQQRLFFTNVVPVGGMACPYIFSYDDQSHQWSVDTTILYKLVGPQAETTQARRLARFNGQLLLREVEAETSYVDMIAVRLIAADGREITLKLNDSLLSVADGHYLILHQGDQRVLTFNVPEGSLPAREAWIVATGYYIPSGQ